ncbi:hypothetical protein MY8738_005312 [Beauveria namnaoensis]
MACSSASPAWTAGSASRSVWALLVTAAPRMRCFGKVAPPHPSANIWQEPSEKTGLLASAVGNDDADRVGPPATAMSLIPNFDDETVHLKWRG